MDTTNQTAKTYTDNEIDIMMDNLEGKAIKALSNEDALLYEYFIASPYMANFDDLNSNEHKLFLGSYASFTTTLKNYIAAGQTAGVIYNTGKEYNLDDSKISQIGALIRDLVTGNIFIKDFPITISSKLGIDNIKAGEIANKIISQSFGPIVEDVKRIQRSKFPDKISQIQKDSRPAGLTRPGSGEARPREGAAQPTARPLPPHDVQPQQKPQVPPPVQPAPQSPPPPIRQAPLQTPPQPPSNLTSPQQTGPITYSGPQNIRPIPQRPSEERGNTEHSSANVNPPPVVSHPDKPNEMTAPKEYPPQPLPATKQTPKPRFKVPAFDLGARLDPKGRPDLSGMMIPPQTPSGKAEESLEKELEKVASIIDLRNKPKE